MVSVVLSSHLVADLARACADLVALVGPRVRLAGEIDDLVLVSMGRAAVGDCRRGSLVGVPS